MVTAKMMRSQWRSRPRRLSLTLISVTRGASQALRSALGAAVLAFTVVAFAAGCGPRAHIPPVPAPVAIGADTGRMGQLARTLAPVLYLQRDEWFPLSRAVAIVHPRRRVIAYHLLWKDDVFGAWIPGTIPTDEEIVWVGYDTTGAPTEVWTYWHGAILHTPWRKQQVAIDVQWGKHGSMPHAMLQSDLPRLRTLNSFYATGMLFAWDFWLGNATRKGPWCFCHGYRRYREFDHPMLLTDHLDAVVVASDPRRALTAVFGHPYSEKPWWPWRDDLDKVKGIT